MDGLNSQGKMIDAIVNKRNIRFLFWGLIVIFFIQLVFRIYQYRDNYTVHYNFKYWEKRYYESQWAVPNSTNSIGDDGLYAYAGYKYVYDGLNPILNSAEVPPLGKYLIGYTILVFGNQNVFGIITGILSLSLFYILNLILFKNKFIAFLPVFLFSFDKLFYEQLQANYIDLLYLSFLFLAFIFALKRKYLVSSIFLGCFASTKFPPISIFAAITIASYVFLNNRKDFKKFVLSLVLWPVFFIFTYARFFILGNNFVDFLKVLKYFLNYYSTGAKSQNHLMVLYMIFLGKWPTWWAGVLRVDEWNLLWPVSFLASLFYFKKFKVLVKDPVFITIIWSIIYLCFLLIIPVSPRYLLLLFPFLYNVLAWILLKGTGRKLQHLLG